MKEYTVHAPTFHPYHYQINSQNSVQTPPQNSYIQNLNNSKLAADQQKLVMTYDSQNVNKTITSREDSRERDKSFENCDKKNTEFNNGTMNSDLKSFEDKIKQIEKLDVGMEAKNQQFQRIVEEYKSKFSQQDSSQQSDRKDLYMKIVNDENEHSSNTRSDGNNEEIDVENYINKNLEKNIKIIEEIKQKEKPTTDKELQQRVIQKILNEKINSIQTPKKNMQKQNQSPEQTYQNEEHRLPPHHITSSMRKIRNSPELAEDEQINTEKSESPESIVPNNYDEDDDDDK